PIAAFLRRLLYILSLVYGLAVAVISAFYRVRPRRLRCKVISVGNITLGGTGKTVLVQCLAEKLNRKGRRIAVLTRGYKRNPGLAGREGMGDEPAMLKDKLPYAAVIVDKNRLRGASRAAREYNADTLILDDGMQQWKIYKDLEIVTIDAENPFGNLRLLPAGFLREPLSALRRADVFVLTNLGPGCDTPAIAKRLRGLNPRALLAEARHCAEGFRDLGSPNAILNPDAFKGRSALAFSGIGNPGSFEETLSSLGVNIAEALRFADHHDYSRKDLEHILSLAKDRGLDIIVTTEKDAVKVSRLKTGRTGIFSLNVRLRITKNEAEFDRRLFELYPL
ncbi:MAG: tetraacyldisaccharide 4'-kinase, partial [Candidatus Omnitrophica bacterium]|nr:tetraacyldisaccharide 4'-kinase [Candidatus Omnitrophota bacterium]